MKKSDNRNNSLFERFSNKATKATGSPWAFIIAFAIILGWAISGPLFHFSDTWQLVINTGTTIITFLMVFIIQQSQNKDTIALQLKLNELIAANEHASNRLIDIEDLSEQELNHIKRFYIRLSKLAEKEQDLFQTHSLDEEGEDNQRKSTSRKNSTRTKSTTSKKQDHEKK